MRALPRLQSEDKHDATLTPEDLVAALRVLADEDAAADAFRGSFFKELAQDILFGIFLFALPAGLLVVGFDLAWGLGLILIGVAALLLFVVTPASDIRARTRTLRDELEGTELLNTATEVWRRRNRGFPIFAFLLTPLVALGGAAWLAHELVMDGEVRVLALLLIAVPALTFWTGLALDSFRELQHFSRVASLRGRFEEHMRTSDGQPTDIRVSGTELDVLAKAETHQTQRVVAEAADRLPSVLEDSYSVLVAPEALHDLERLAHEDPEDWRRVQQAILSLQHDPRPPSARPADEVPEATVFLAGERGVEYLIEDDDHRVYVVGIGQRETREGTNAS